MISKQAILLAKAVNYESAGTVEFLVDSSKKFFFLEMNTRLQVEHPVTEFTTEIDIVREMILIASGRDLSFDQSQVNINGWAIESRIYAEDPNSFMPSNGIITQYSEPKDNIDYIRVDSGFSKGSDISIHYDPLISKLITFGNDRNEAISTMLNALDQYNIMGVKTNIPLIKRILSNHRFSLGDINTNFINEEFKSDNKPPIDWQEWNIMAFGASLIHLVLKNRNYLDKFSLFCDKRDKLYVEENSRSTIYDIVQKDPYYETYLGGSHISGEIEWTPSCSVLLIKGSSFDRKFYTNVNNKHKIGVSLDGDTKYFSVYSYLEKTYLEYMTEKKDISSPYILNAPMPGIIKNLFVVPGDSVEIGTNLIIIEAMKMQNIITSPIKAKVREIRIKNGANVDEGDCLIEFYSD